MKHILVVEDNANFHVAFKKLLELKGYKVTVAENLVEAVRALTFNRPDVVTLDCIDDFMSVVNMCGKLNIPVVGLTGWEGFIKDRSGYKAVFEKGASHKCAIQFLDTILS